VGEVHVAGHTKPCVLVYTTNIAGRDRPLISQLVTLLLPADKRGLRGRISKRHCQIVAIGVSSR
jgi:hypothetical protein